MTAQTLPIGRTSTSAVSTAEAIDWRMRSACRDEDPELFFPPPGSGADALAQTDAAVRVCFGCPVINECLKWAMESGQDTGVWGGMSERDRRRLRRGRMRPASSSTVREADLRAPDPVVVEDYLEGRERDVHVVDRLAAIVKGVRRGMTYKEFDRLHGLGREATSTFMSRMRKSYDEKGLEFPDMGRRSGLRVLTEEQVLSIRERYAAGGVTDTELAMSFDVARKTITCVVSGRSYREFGGPIREARGSGVADAPGVVWASKSAGPVNLETDMGEAA